MSIDKGQLLEVLTSYLSGKAPSIASHSVCEECKARGTVCVMVAHGTPFVWGPSPTPVAALFVPAITAAVTVVSGQKKHPIWNWYDRGWQTLGVGQADRVRVLRTFNTWAEPFREASKKIEEKG